MRDVELHTIKGTYINCTAHAILKYSLSIYCFCCGLWFIIGLEKLINRGGPIKLWRDGKNIKKLISGGGHLFGTYEYSETRCRFPFFQVFENNFFISVL